MESASSPNIIPDVFELLHVCLMGFDLFPIPGSLPTYLFIPLGDGWVECGTSFASSNEGASAFEKEGLLRSFAEGGGLRA